MPALVGAVAEALYEFANWRVPLDTFDSEPEVASRNHCKRPGQAAETYQAYESSTSRTFRSNAAAVNGLLRKGIWASNTPCRTMVSLV